MSLHTNNRQYRQTDFNARAREAVAIDQPAATTRVVSNSEQVAPPDDLTDIKTWARVARDIFGPGVKLRSPDPYRGLR